MLKAGGRVFYPCLGGPHRPTLAYLPGNGGSSPLWHASCPCNPHTNYNIPPFCWYPSFPCNTYAIPRETYHLLQLPTKSPWHVPFPCSFNANRPQTTLSYHLAWVLHRPTLPYISHLVLHGTLGMSLSGARYRPSPPCPTSPYPLGLACFYPIQQLYQVGKTPTLGVRVGSPTLGAPYPNPIPNDSAYLAQYLHRTLGSRPHPTLPYIRCLSNDSA